MARIIRTYFVQRPTSRKDYNFDWTDFLGEDTISSSVVTVEPLGLTIDSTQTITPIVKTYLTGGVLGTDYKVKCKITTAAGIIDTADFILQVRE
jgi:hypothetical protein